MGDGKLINMDKEFYKTLKNPSPGQTFYRKGERVCPGAGTEPFGRALGVSSGYARNLK